MMNRSETTRYDEFCQFRKEIRHSGAYLIVGIDVAKDPHHAFFGNAFGRTFLRRLVFENNAAGYQRLIERAGQLQRQHGLCRVIFGLEATGNYHKPLSNWLLEQGQQLVLASNNTVAENRKTLDGRWDKHDTKDSANVADLIAQGKCQFFEWPRADLTSLRNLLALRNRLKKDEHAVRMQIRNGLVTKYFPELDRLWGNCLEENLAIVRWCLDPVQIASMPFEDFVKRVTRRDRGLRQLRRLKSIWLKAAVSVGCPVDAATRFEAQMLVERLQDLRERIEQTETQIEQTCRGFSSYRLLLSIPGFGPYVAALVLARIGDPQRFAGRKQVIRLAGYDLNAKRSGRRSNDAVPVISKRGNAELRYGLYQAALIASYRHDRFRQLFARYLQGREQERGIRTKMRVKLAVKMLVIAWTMMKDQTAFDPSLLQV
jgi:transposase